MKGFVSSLNDSMVWFGAEKDVIWKSRDVPSFQIQKYEYVPAFVNFEQFLK